MNDVGLLVVVNNKYCVYIRILYGMYAGITEQICVNKMEKYKTFQKLKGEKQFFFNFVMISILTTES